MTYRMLDRKKRQSPTTLNGFLEHKENLQKLIKVSKLKAYKNNSAFLNSSKESTQF